MPCWLMMKVITPESRYFTGVAITAKPPREFAVDDVLLGAAWGFAALGGEDAEGIAVNYWRFVWV